MCGLDCWGLTRLVREEMTGQLLPEFGGVVDRRRMTKLAPDVKDGLSPSEPKDGAIAFAYRGRLCIHVGIIVKADGRLWVLETDEKTGVTISSIRRFESRFVRVEFYD
ncbi:hypothetical protein ACMG4M_05360 [Alcanivorax sp. IL3]